MPKQISPYISPKNEDEAIDYVMSARSVWFNTPGALDWLREAVDKSDKPLNA